MDPSTYIRLLPDEICWKLAAKLDGSKKPNWKGLIAKMPKNMFDEKKKVSFHMQSLKPSGSPTLELLKDLGKEGITVQNFIDWMQTGSVNDEYKDIADILLKNEQRDPDLSPVILEGPVSDVFHAGRDLMLSCCSNGELPMKFQWFHGRQQIHGQTSQFLTLKNAREYHSGFYACLVSNKHGYTYSNWAKVDIVTVSISQLYDPKILCHPNSQRCSVGHNVWLVCDAVGNPPPAYTWYKDGVQLHGLYENCVQLTNVTEVHQGVYVCEASNLHGKVRSLPAQVTVEDAKDAFMDGKKVPMAAPAASSGYKNAATDIAKNTLMSTVPRGPDAHTDTINVISSMSMAPTYKFALLIGNQKYHYAHQLGKLVHPMNDTRDLAACLSSIGFHVVSLIDLDRKSMQDVLRYFCYLLGSGVYAVFYFAGHGFEKNGESYMMPVDATEKYNPGESLSVSDVLLAMTAKRPKLTVLLIDCCRAEAAVEPISASCKRLCSQDDREGVRENERNNTPAVQRKNVLIAYGCCSQGRVLESAARKNGFFAEHLIDHIHKDIKVSDVIFEVARGINSENIVDPATGRSQVVYYHSTLCDTLKLTDGTLPCPSSEQGRLWQQAHTAPEVPVTVLKNEDIEVKLVFSAEFSNCMVIFSQVITNDHTAVHSILFVMPSQIGGAHTEVLSSPMEAGMGHNYVRIWNLERLNDDITIHVQVKYSVNGMRRQQNALYIMKEKPLYAKIVEQMKYLPLD